MSLVTMGGVQFTSRRGALCLLVGEMVYAYYFVLVWKRASSRLLALLLLLPPTLLLPWRSPSSVERIFYSFIFIWVIGTKLLLLAWDRGPAGDPVAVSSFPRFFCAMVFSTHLKCEDRCTSPIAAFSNIAGSVSKASRNGTSAVNGLIHRKSMANGDGEGEKGIRERKPGENSCASVGCRYVGMLVGSQKGYIMLLRSLFYFVASASLVRMLLVWKGHIPESVLALPYCFLMYFACLFIFEGAAAIPAMIFRIQMHPQFNMPYLATSLGDFWGWRWNLFLNNLLRASIYEPIIQWDRRKRGKQYDDVGSSKPSKVARAVATFTSFLVSGLMHELILFYFIQMRPTWEMTGFFVLNGIGTIVEMVVIKSKIWPQRFSLPTVVRWAYTIGFVYAAAVGLFFPPLDRPGVIKVSLVDLSRFVDYVEQTIGLSSPKEANA